MENKKLKVGVVFGGLSAESEVSLATGRYIYSLLDPLQFTGTPFYLDKGGQLWQVPDKLVIQNTTADVESRLEEEVLRSDSGQAQKIHFEDLTEKIDLVFNALLGKYGEDGCIQGVLEMLGIPYTGSGILASALGMDKKMHKKMIAAAGLKVAKDITIDNLQLTIDKGESVIKGQVSNVIGFPCIIKPTREGSSMGVSVVKDENGLDVAFEYAFKYDREVLVEEYLKGLEFTCVVWGLENPQAMLPTEIVFEGDFFTYEGKYMPGKTQTITPARVSKEVREEIQRISVEVYKLIGCVGYGRVDGFVVPRSSSNLGHLSDLSRDEVSVYVTEPHTGSIMVPSSFVFQQASKFRIEMSDTFTGKKMSAPLTPRMLVTKIVEMAIEAHKNKRSLL